jgi:hypothetical protein
MLIHFVGPLAVLNGNETQHGWLKNTGVRIALLSLRALNTVCCHIEKKASKLNLITLFPEIKEYD